MIFTHFERDVNRGILRFARYNLNQIDSLVCHNKRIGHLRFLGISLQGLADIGIIPFDCSGILQADAVVEDITSFQIDRIGRYPLQQAVRMLWAERSGEHN